MGGKAEMKREIIHDVYFSFLGSHLVLSVHSLTYEIVLMVLRFFLHLSMGVIKIPTLSFAMFKKNSLLSLLEDKGGGNPVLP